MQGLIRVVLFGTSEEVGVPLSRVLKVEEAAADGGVTLHFARGRQVRIAGNLAALQSSIAAAATRPAFAVGRGG